MALDNDRLMGDPFPDIWEWRGLGAEEIPDMVENSSVGHVMITERNSDDVILSQFPYPRGTKGENKPFDYKDTMKKEGRQATKIFKVFVPNDDAFDKMVKEHLDRDVWDAYPDKPNETHCSRAAYDALKAGGVPVSGQDTGQILPGTLGDLLQGLTTKHQSTDKWDVKPKTMIGPQKPIELPKDNPVYFMNGYY